METIDIVMLDMVHKLLLNDIYFFLPMESDWNTTTPGSSITFSFLITFSEISLYNAVKLSLHLTWIWYAKRDFA